MATLSTATANFNQTVTALVMREIEENLRDDLVYMQPENGFASAQNIPGTNLFRYISYLDMTVTTNNNVITPGTQPWLTEGDPSVPANETLAIDYEEFSGGQAGRRLAISDVAMLESPHRLFAVAAERIARNMVATVDLYVANVLHAGTARILRAGVAGTRAATLATEIMTGALIRRAVAVLKQANVPTFSDGTYHAFISPLVAFDLQSDTAASGWLETSKYAAPDRFLTGEIGKYMGVRFIETNIGNLFANTGAGPNLVDVYSTFIFGPDCWAFGDYQSTQAYMVSPGGDHGDLLAQQALIGWKGMWGARLFDNLGSGDRYLRIESASSLGANT